MSLAAFDFDGTLSESEMTVLLGQQCGVADRMAEITERAMSDEIGYAESLRERVSLLEGLSLDHAEDAFAEVRLREGAVEVLDGLADAGVRTAILTGGFERGVDRALDREGVSVDRVIANRLVVNEEALIGEVEGRLVEGTKDDALFDLATDLDVPIEETIAVGDGANDRPMLAACGLAIGYDPKPTVEPVCERTVESMAELRDVFEAAGLPGS